MENIDNMQAQMGNASKQMDKNPKEMLEIKNSATEMKNTFDFTRRQAKGGISGLKDSGHFSN